jgi:phosphoglycerate dehydrogenase-like enzyme
MKAVIYPFGANEPIVQLTQDFPQLQWAVVTSVADVEREIGDAVVLITSNRVCTPAYGEVLRRVGRALRWIHFGSAGLELGIAMGLPEGVTVTNSSGVKSTMVSEHAVMMLLALVRRLPEMRTHQQSHHWDRDGITAQMRTLDGATVCVIGLGNIGQEVARKLKAFDARVIAVSREGTAGKDIDGVFPRERIGEALAVSDAVVICTSGDESSVRLIGAPELAAMKPTAFIVNVARGNIIDEPALVAALQHGRLAGAALDVAEAEPLPTDSPLWGMPNVIISPHVAGTGSTGYPQQKKLFAENLRRLQSGKPLLNECRIPAGV